MGYALLLSLLAGLFTAVGGAAALLVPPTQKSLAAGMGFAGAVMVTVSLADMLPEAFEAYCQNVPSLSAAVRVLSLFCLGGVLALLLGKLLPEEGELLSRKKGRRADAYGTGKPGAIPLQAAALRSAAVTVAVVVAHNLPEGIVTLFTGYADPTLGLTVALAIGMHNFPEGVVIAAPVLAATGSRARAFWAAALSGLAEPAGALLAFFLLRQAIAPLFLSGLLCIVAGMMCAVSWCELLPAGYRTAQGGAAALGALLGCAVMCFGIYCIS